MELLSGQDEAALSFSGATAELSAETGPWLVADIGGGSTELVVGPEPCGARSLDLGCVRVTERFLHHDPPTPAELAAAAAWLAAQYHEAEADVPALPLGHGPWSGWPARFPPWPATTRASPSYDRKAVHHYRLSRQCRGAGPARPGRPACGPAGGPARYRGGTGRSSLWGAPWCWPR